MFQRSLSCIVLVLISIPAQSANLDRSVIRTTALNSLKKWNVPGVVIVAVHGEQSFVEVAGVRSLMSDQPPARDAYLPLASCTKAMTIALMTKLVERGILDWDAPVKKYLPEFHVSDPQVDALLTLRDLVTHRSGMKGHDLLWYHAPWNQDELLKRIPHLPIERPFRSSFEYSTLLYLVATRAAERATGQNWSDLLHKELTQPLGMESVIVTTKNPKIDRTLMMTGYRKVYGKIQSVPLYESPEPNAAGSVFLKPDDLVPWLRFQLGDHSAGKPSLITSKYFQEMHEPWNPLRMDAALRAVHPDTVQMSYGMGWLLYDYRGHAIVAHGGMIDGFRIQITLVPKAKLGFAVICNLQESKMNQAITNRLVDHVLDLPVKDWDGYLLGVMEADDRRRAAEWDRQVRFRRSNVPPSIPLKDYSGVYNEPAYGDAIIQFSNGKLIWKWSSYEIELEHWEGDVFRMTSGFLKDRLLGFRVGKTGSEGFSFEGQVFKTER